MGCPMCFGTGEVVCQQCIDRYGTKTIDGKNIEFGFFSSSNIFFSRIQGSNMYTQDIDCYINGRRCIVNEKDLIFSVL